MLVFGNARAVATNGSFSAAGENAAPGNGAHPLPPLRNLMWHVKNVKAIASSKSASVSEYWRAVGVADAQFPTRWEGVFTAMQAEMERANKKRALAAATAARRAARAVAAAEAAAARRAEGGATIGGTVSDAVTPPPPPVPAVRRAARIPVDVRTCDGEHFELRYPQVDPVSGESIDPLFEQCRTLRAVDVIEGGWGVIEAGVEAAVAARGTWVESFAREEAPMLQLMAKKVGGATVFVVRHVFSEASEEQHGRSSEALAKEYPQIARAAVATLTASPWSSRTQSSWKTIVGSAKGSAPPRKRSSRTSSSPPMPSSGADIGAEDEVIVLAAADAAALARRGAPSAEYCLRDALLCDATLTAEGAAALLNLPPRVVLGTYSTSRSAAGVGGVSLVPLVDAGLDLVKVKGAPCVSQLLAQPPGAFLLFTHRQTHVLFARTDCETPWATENCPFSFSPFVLSDASLRARGFTNINRIRRIEWNQ
jgi:hypothetical protein